MHTQRAISRLHASAVALGLIGASLFVSSAAQAAPGDAAATDLQNRIDEIIEDYPGGTQIGPNGISWDDGDMLLTLEAPEIGVQAVGSCATGSFCAYSGTSLTGSKLSYSSCTTHSTAGISVHSIANARGSGTVQAKNSSNSVLASVGAGKRLNSAPGGISKLSCA